MFYLFQMNEFPLITNCYSVTRNTVWQIAEKHNILIFIQKGSCLITFDGETYKLNKGDIFFIPANHSYTRRSLDNSLCTMFYIHFTFSKNAEEYDAGSLIRKLNQVKKLLENQVLNDTHGWTQQNLIYLQNHFVFSAEENLLDRLKEISLFSNRRPFLCELQSSIVLCGILSVLSQKTIDGLSGDIALYTVEQIPPNLVRAIRYIRSRYTEKISLDDLSGYCNVSKQQLIRYFKDAFGMTPVHYITDYKIAQAKDLLFYQPQLTIGEISDELGFTSQHYFTKVFLKSTGETPSAYRFRTTHYSEEEKP